MVCTVDRPQFHGASWWGVGVTGHHGGEPWHIRSQFQGGRRVGNWSSRAIVSGPDLHELQHAGKLRQIRRERIRVSSKGTTGIRHYRIGCAMDLEDIDKSSRVAAVWVKKAHARVAGDGGN